MATRSEDIPPIPVPPIGGDRLRRTSERSDAPSEESHLSLQPIRRRPTRSLTEVRPDAYIFDDGLHFEVRTVEEEDECSEHLDVISAAGKNYLFNWLCFYIRVDKLTKHCSFPSSVNVLRLGFQIK